MTASTTPIRRLKQFLREQYEAQRIAAFERRAAAFRNHPRPQTRALVFTAAGVGSLGDEAMLLAAGRIFRDHGIERLTVVSYGPGDAWRPLEPFDDVLDLGRRYSTAFWSTCEDILGTLGSTTHFLVLGADVMDGYYSPYECIRRSAYARMAAAAGVRTTIGGFSFNDSPHRRSVRSLASLPTAVHLMARDPLSWRRLRELLPREVDLGADLAFLLQPDTETDLVRSIVPWLEAERRDNRFVLGVNANYLVAPNYRAENTGDRLVEAYVRGLTAFASGTRPVSLLLIPHDFRAMVGRYDDLQLLQAIAERLPASLAAHTRVIDTRLGAREAKALVGHTDLVLSGRMHLAIAALDQGVPALGVTYQGKFEGLYEHFLVDGLSLAPDKLLEPGALESFLNQLATRRDDLAAAITRRLPQVRELAMANFAALVASSNEEAR